MKLYLDDCCFNRPFDEQIQMRIRLEAEAKLYIQSRIFENEFQLVWSYIVEYENMFNPHEERKNAILKWKKIASTEIVESEEIISMAERL